MYKERIKYAERALRACKRCEAFLIGGQFLYLDAVKGSVTCCRDKLRSGDNMGKNCNDQGWCPPGLFKWK